MCVLFIYLLFIHPDFERRWSRNKKKSNDPYLFFYIFRVLSSPALIVGRLFFWNEKLKERKRERGGIAFEDEIEMRKERKEK